MACKDLIGLKFGLLLVQSKASKNKRDDQLWNCLCTCGHTSIVKTGNLTCGYTKSCGCLKTGSVPEDLTGKTFYYLTVVKLEGRTKCRQTKWICRCICGNERKITRGALISGKTKSCGCWNREQKHLLVGSLNPHWNTTLTTENRLSRIYHANELRDWATAVKIRDEFICKICKESPSGRLTSHHMNSWDSFPDERYKIDNGVCVCQDCHISFHKKFGYGNNTKEEWESYVRIRSENSPC